MLRTTFSKIFEKSPLIVRRNVTLFIRVGQTIAGKPSGLREESPGSVGQDGR